MTTSIVEFHGAPPLSPESRRQAKGKNCPFVEEKCKKTRSGGACVLAPTAGAPVIICPNRLYAADYEVIKRVARECFGDTAELITGVEAEFRRGENLLSGNEVVVYGQGYSGEIGIRAPTADGEAEGSFKIDFLLTKVDEDLNPVSFVAVEVQTIDTTDSYKPAAEVFYSAATATAQQLADAQNTKAGFNWENVSKRILPQIIYKGHALRREIKAQFGLYFILPQPVYEKIKTRVGGRLLEYPRGPGTVTFHSYGLGEPVPDGARQLHLQEAVKSLPTVTPLSRPIPTPWVLADVRSGVSFGPWIQV